MEPPAAPAAEAAAPAPGRLARGWRAAAWALVHAAVAAAIQLGFARVPQDADTAYHVAVARLLREHGILHAFPWTPFSWLAGNYADKELAFHLLLAPLSDLEWTAAARIAGTVGGTAALSALHLVLRRERVPWAGLWALLPLLASSVFVFRFALVRPHLFSIALALVALWAASRGRLVVLAAVSVAYPWFYVAWQMPVFLAAVAEAASLAAGRRIRWQPLAVAAGGVAAGVLLHPNAWNLVRFSGIVLWDVLFRGAWGGRPGLELGLELLPFAPRDWATLLAPPVAMVAASLVLAWRRRREDAAPLAFSAAALAFGLLTLRTARFAEYLVPFAAAALALSVAALPRRRGRVLAGTLAACALYSGAETAGLLARLRAREMPLPPDQAEAMAARIPPGAQVFTCEWGLTGVLMLALPGRRFVVALDPTLFAIHDPERYDLWFRLPREGPPGLAATIRERFGARHVACAWDDRFRPFFDRIAFEPGVRTLLFTDRWNVYALEGP